MKFQVFTYKLVPLYYFSVHACNNSLDYKLMINIKFYMKEQ
jgi:hypothetical protein